MSPLLEVLGVPTTQVPISLTTLLSHVIPLAVSCLAMAVLAITPQTRVFRIALWPVVTLLTVRAAFVDWSLGKSELVFINGELMRFTMCIPLHALSWMLAEKPLVRHLRPANSSPSTIMDALDLVTNLRGVGWDWSRGLYTPRETRPTNRIRFVLYALVSLVCNFMMCNFVVLIVSTFVSNTPQLTIFDESLPLFPQYLRASTITVLAGFIAYNGLLVVYNLSTVLGVLLFGQDPAQWPPGLENPWCATSLAEFWGHRWHQWFRHTFIVSAYPFSAILGQPGRITGAFLASGLAHHLMAITHDRHSEMWRMFVGFGMMAPGMIAERAFYKLTGKKVGGVLGWVWTVSWLLSWYSIAAEGFVRARMYSLSGNVEHKSPVLEWVEECVKGFDAWLHTI